MDVLIGRQAEIARLDSLLDAARQGRGSALVVHGEAGIGKSALLDHLAGTATGFVVLRASGAEFETELPYAALHQLCGPLMERVGALPGPHRRALEIAFGTVTGTPDPFLVGAATLGLLVERGRPLLCVIDDAQWLDHASARALAFVVRRVSAERVAVAFGEREGVPDGDGAHGETTYGERARGERAYGEGESVSGGGGVLGRLPRLAVSGLGESEARSLLKRALPVPLDERVRDRILAEARGNPLALLELPRTAGLAGMAGGFDLPAPGAAEHSFRMRLKSLPPRVQLVLIVAAAEPVGDPALLWRAAGLLGIEDAVNAAQGSLAEFGTRVRFVHPLARSAVYRAASSEDRRRAHAVLAAVSDPVADPDRVAWHRAQASAGPDEEVAAGLARCAARAQARGGVAAAAAFLARSAALTLDAGRRTERALAAVEAKLSVGDFEVATELLSTVEPEDPRVDLLRGRISFARHRGGDRPTDHLLQAAARLANDAPARARACYVDAIEMSLLIGGLDTVIAAARTAPRAPVPPSGADTALDGMIALASRGHSDAARILRPLVRDSDHETWRRWPTLGFLLALELWDADAMHEIASGVAASGRESGSFHMLPIGLAMLATVAAHRGDFAAAMETISEEEAIAAATGAAPLVYPRIHLTALRGRRAEADGLFASVGPHMTLSVQYATAVLNNGLAEYPTALAAAARAVESGDLGLSGLALPELVEAAVRCGETGVARSALASLRERAGAGGSAWGTGIEAYARALVDDDEKAYQDAVSLLAHTSQAVQMARAHLIYGEWLRRQGRRRDARGELRRAHDLLSGMGAQAFAERAAGELKATGERARSRSAKASETLTVQEVHIARLVADGATSKEVAAKLFLSPRTVDAHLRNIFRKLGLTSRRQLRNLSDIR